MIYSIESSDFASFEISEMEQQDEGNDRGQRIRLDFPKGEIYYQEQTLKDGISILQGTYQLEEDTRILGEGPSSLLEIRFNLSDHDIIFNDKRKKVNRAPRKSGNIAFLSAEDNKAEIFFRKTIAYNTFDVHLPMGMIEKYAGESGAMDAFIQRIDNDRSGYLSENGIQVTPGIYDTLADMKNCKFEGLTRRIYLESKVFELIALLHHELEPEKAGIPLSRVDRDNLHHVVTLIQENLDKPYTIPELARMVGINQTKLKSGFKSIFGCTVFGYLQNLRMRQAKTYLADTELSIHQISTLLGYQNTSNFTTAFKKANGFPPTQLRRKTPASPI